MDIEAQLRSALVEDTLALAVTGLRAHPASWYRRVPVTDARYGPWRSVGFVDYPRWRVRSPCLYLVLGSDGRFRYAGVSINGLKDRWRLSPARDEHGSMLEHQLFHNRCWPALQDELVTSPSLTFEVHSLFADGVLSSRLVPNLPHEEPASIVRLAEDQVRRARSPDFLTWNAT